jgi:hypothetical protein
VPQPAAASAAQPVVRVAYSPDEGEVLLAAGPAQQPQVPETAAAALASGGTIEVANGTGRRFMAARMRAFLAGKGLEVARLSNADHFTHAVTIISFLPGHRTLAEVLSASLPVAPRLEEASGQSAAVRLQLGGDLLEFDSSLLKAERKDSHADPV